jgi:hypothetical protein
MATPIANGVAALIMAANPFLTAQEVQDILESTCDPIGDPNKYGHGRVNAFKAVLAAGTFTPIDATPSAISVYEGTFLSGSLGDILAENPGGGPTYNVRSVKSGKVGQASGVVITYVLPTTKAKVTSIDFIFQAKESPMTLATAFVYVWNYNTGKYDTFVQFPVGAGFVTSHKKVTSSPSRYLSNSGQVKILFRTLSTASPGRKQPYPFVLNYGYAHIAYTERP